MIIEKKHIQNIKELMGVILRIDFVPYKDSTVMRRVEKRMKALQLQKSEEYLKYLKKHEEEVRLLGKAIFINVTDFFRDIHVFQKIKRIILPNVFLQNKDSVKIWIAGCSTGEEAYSMAILIEEFCAEHDCLQKVKIIATDIKEEAIDKARLGLYSTKDLMGVNKLRLEKFFDKEGDKYRIKKQIRSKVVFAIHDITSDPPFARVDILTCRNLLIYLDKNNQQKVLENLVFALNIGGFLVLGKSETAVDISYDIKSVNKVSKIYKRVKNTRISPRANFDITYQDSLFAPLSSLQNENEESMKEHESVKSFQHIIHQKYAPAVVIIDEQFYVKHITHTAKAYINTPEDYTKIYSLASLASEAVTALVRAAISEIKKGKLVNTYPPLPVDYKGNIKQISITVEALTVESDRTAFYAIIFEESHENGKPSTDVAKRINLALQTQLADTEENLRKTIEKLESTNQNLLASNEELQSTNEEYISVNEELQTINSEYQESIDELSISNKDVDHLLQSTDIGTLFLDDKLHIRKFTNPIKTLINIDDIDLKRPLKNFTHNIKDINIYKEAKAVLDSNQAIEKEVISEDDIHYLMRATPYDVDEENRKGIVLSFVNIQQLIDAEKALAESELLYRSVFNSANDGIVLVDENEKKVSNVNQRQLKMLGYTKEEYLQKKFRDIFTEKQSDGQSIEAKVKQCKKRKDTHQSIEWTLKRKDNTLIETEISTVNMPPPYEGYTLNIIRDITQKKQGQLEIIASQKRFQAVFDNSPIGISIADMQFNMIRVNKAFARMMGYTPKQLTQMAFSDITYHEDRKINRKILESLVVGKRKVINFDKRYVKKSGKIFWARLWVSMMTDSSGEKFYLANIRDISKEKEAAKKLQDSEVRYRSLFEKNIDAVLIYGLKNNKTLSVNKSACQLFECSKKQLLQSTPMDYFPEFQENGEPSMQFFGRQMQKYMQTGEVRHFMQFQTKKGKHREVEITAFRLYDSPDSEMVVQFKDITVQKNAQKALQSSEQHFRSLFENSADALAIMDANTLNIIDCNKYSLKLFKAKKKEVIGLNAFKFSADIQIDGRPKLEHLKEITNIVNEKGYCLMEKWINLRPNGTEFYSEFSVTRLPAPDQRIYILQIRDITEKLQAQQAIQESEERFRSIYENSGNATLIIELDTMSVTDSNATFLELTGFTQKDLQTLSPIDMTPEFQPDGHPSADYMMQHTQIVKQTGYYFLENWQLQRKDGSLFYADLSLSKIYKDKDNVIVVQMRDITEKRTTQQALQESEQRFRSIYENSGEAILLKDLNQQKVTQFNSKFTEMTGYTEEGFEKLGGAAITLEPQADGRSAYQHHEEHMQILNETGYCFVENWLLIHKDGHVIHTNMSLSKLYEDRNDAIVVQFRDITESYQAKQAIKESEQRFRSLFEHSADSLSIIDSTTLAIIDCNKKTLEMYNVNKEDLVGSPPIIFSAEIQADGRPTITHIQEHIAILKKKGYCFAENWISRRTDGTEFYSEISLTNFPSPNEHMIVVQIRDITERHQAQQVIKESEERFHSLFEHSADAVTIIDTKTFTFLDSNKKSLEMFGYSKEELMIKTPKDLSTSLQVDGRTTSEHLKELTGIVKKQGYYSTDNWINKRADGTEFHSEVSVINFPAPNEHIFIIQRKDITERLQAQQEIQRQKDYLRTIIDYIPLIVTVKDTKGNYLLTNQIATTAFGMSVDEVIGRNDEEFKSREGWRSVLDSDKKVVKTGEVLHINDIIAEDPNGEIRYGQATKVPIKNEVGEVTQILTVVNDITEIKKAEKLLQEQKDYLNTIINLSPSMITAKDTEGNFVLANQAATAIYGVPIEKIIGKNRRKFGFGFGAEKSLESDKKVIKIGEIQQYNDATLNMANGEERTFQIIKVPLRNDEGEIIQVLAVANDITELKEIEHHLRESETKFRAVFENSHAILTILDKDGNIAEQNRLLLKDSELNLGRPAWESRWFAHDKKLIAQIKKDLKKIAKGETITRQFTYQKTPDAMGHITTTTKPIYTDNGKDILFLLAESREISDLMQSQDALADKVEELNTKNMELKKYIDSNMQLENFAYITSHDLREPLRTISGFANLLERKYQGKFDSTADEYLSYILASTKNMNALIEDLLIFSRVHTGEHKVEEIQLNDLLEQITKSISRSIQETDAKIQFKNIPKTIIANETKMKQLFQNLISNAIKFRQPDTQPEIILSAKSKDKFWEFTIEDNGIGINEDYFDKIFMIFKRLHTKDQYEGTGIGLSLCKKIVEQHGGEIQVKSKEGEGTTFTFTIEK